MSDYPAVRSVQVIQVIEVVAAEGKGERGDPVRLVTYLYTLGGEQLLRRDAWSEEEQDE